MGQRSLLGVGVLLAWLLLFHLLVNIWLLCVFTSFLVVIGGWLCSQAALDSNTVLHLERFISLDQITPSEEDEEQLDQEIQNTVTKIVRDFVTSWYSTVSTERGFESDVHDAMIYMAMELKRRARQVDKKEMTQKILDLFGCHLQDFTEAKQLVPEQQRKAKWDSERMWRAYSSVIQPHTAMTSKGMEINYMRALVDLLLHVLVPSPHLETRSGRFVVGELITSNVMLPLIDKLSDPDWLNLFLIALFGKPTFEVEDIEENVHNTTPPLSAVEAAPSLCDLKQELQPNVDLDTVLDRQVPNNAHMPSPEPTACDEFDCTDLDIPQTTEEDEPVQPFLRHYLRGSKSNPFYQETDSDLDSPLTDYQQSSLDSLPSQEDGTNDKLGEGPKNNGVESEDGDSLDASCPKVFVNSQPVVDMNGSALLKVNEGTNGNNQESDKEGITPQFNSSGELLLGAEQAGVTSPNELTVGSPSQATSPQGSFSFVPLSSPEGPVIIQNLRITGTITAKEHRGTSSHPYTLYTIKYETAMGCENQESLQPISEEAEAQAGSDSPSAVLQIAYHMVNRRYREFLNLQTRLEERSDLRKLIKGVKGPKKIFPDMPFGNMDSDKIEARKGLLETFLKQLCAIPEIANSEEMQEFLALNTDARIAFVKKPFLTSRIDKMMVNAIVDTLKTAFPRSEPQSPTDDMDEADGVRIGADKKNKSRLKFATKNVPLMNGSDVRPLFSFDHTRTVFSGMTLGDLESFITDRERLALRQDLCSTESPIASDSAPFSNRDSREKPISESVSEMALAEVTLDILCLLMREQWSWLCTQNIQRTIRLLFGTLLNSWLDVRVANLMCTRYWVKYLLVIQEAVWPGGALPTKPKIERTQQQKEATKQEALQCLMDLLPDLISDMLGSDKYKITWQNALDSLQDPFINRHLVYSVLDLLLEVLVPETSEEDFQKSLLQSLTKTPEKLQN